MALADAGFEVTAIDISTDLLGIASATVPTAHFINASIYDEKIPPCEAVLAVGEPLTYHAGAAAADNLIRSLCSAIIAYAVWIHPSNMLRGVAVSCCFKGGWSFGEGVRPEKVDMFSRKQTYRGKSQKPLNLSRIGGG